MQGGNYVGLEPKSVEVVRRTGLEPAIPFGNKYLKLARLPFRHRRDTHMPQVASLRHTRVAQEKAPKDFSKGASSCTHTLCLGVEEVPRIL